MARRKTRRPSTEEDRAQEVLQARAKLDAELSKYQRPIAVMLVNMADTTEFFDRFGDVSGFVRMKRYVETVRVIVARHGGTLASVAGDKVLAWFENAPDTLRCAVELLQKFDEQNRMPRPGSKEIQIRVGMNYGPALIKNDEPFGHAVKLAARIQTIAEPGQILLSALLADQVQEEGFALHKVSDAAALPGGEQVEIYELSWRNS